MINLDSLTYAGNPESVADVAELWQDLLGLSPIVRHSVYGFVHAGMGLTLCMFFFGVWRALRPKPAEG